MNIIKIKKLTDVYKKKERYKILHKLGEGGLSKVFCSFDKVLNRYIAIKELKKENFTDYNLLRAFIIESRLVAYLDHPGIVSIYDSFLNENKLPVYTMKLVDGIKLSSILKYRKNEVTGYSKLVLNKYLDILRKICETMAFAHDKGVLHLDLKPDNILIGDYGEVMIMDWGSALLYNDTQYNEYIKKYSLDDSFLMNFFKEEENFILGTPEYMSPEQTTTPRNMLTPASDIFSVGIIFYQMLTGEHPFAVKKKTTEIIHDIRYLEPKEPALINKDIPPMLSSICQKMLKKEEHKRYKSFHDILKDLDIYFTSGESFISQTFEKGDIIVKEGEIGDFAFTILDGEVEVYKTVNNEKKILATLKSGETVGELALFTNKPRSATVKATKKTTIRIMSKESINKELEKLSPWVTTMISKLSERFILQNEKLAELE